MKQLSTGIVGPDFTLQTINGRTVQLSKATLDRPVVLAFYKAGCPTCQLTFPYLQRIHAELRDASKFKIYGVSQDEATETGRFAEEFGITFDILIDEHPYAVSTAYGLEFVPTIFAVGTDGIIQLSDYGFSKATLSEIGRPLQLFTPDDGLPATRPG